jgi:hypothetical protein
MYRCSNDNNGNLAAKDRLVPPTQSSNRSVMVNIITPEIAHQINATSVLDTAGNVLATVKGYTSTSTRQGKDYLTVDKLNIDLAIKNIRMRVDKIFNNNRILSKPISLYFFCL